MRPRTKINVPEPVGSEYENFDRLTRILASKVKPPQTVRKKKAEAKAKRQKRRLPRP